MMFGAVTAQAQEKKADHTSLIQKIAQKFNLKEADVKTVFDAHHTEMKVKMQTRVDEKLSQLVKEGKITEAQKKLIIEKHKELQAKHEQQKEAMKNMTPEQRKAAMEAEKKALQEWATQHGIDPNVIMMKFVMKGSKHFK